MKANSKHGKHHEVPSVDRKSLLAETLRQRIVGMQLAPGAVVDELQLSREFGLSRPPVREIMRQLAAEGYLELEANRPARVSPMSHQSLRSFFLAAPLIYVATTELAAVNASAEGIARLRQIQAEFRRAITVGDVQQRVISNNALHLEIGRLAQNQYLMPSLRRLLIDHSRLAKTFYRLEAPSDMLAAMEIAAQQHDQIIDAIEARDVASAARLIREHWELSRQRMEEYVMPAPLEVRLVL